MNLQFDADNRSPRRLLNDRGECVAKVYVTDQKTRKRTLEAERVAAQLEASGDLLETCRYVRDVLSGSTGDMFRDMSRRLDAVIAKAENYNVVTPLPEVK